MGEPQDVDNLIKNMNVMGENLTSAAGILGTNVHRGADRMAEAIEKAAAASDRHTGRLVFATWALVAVTVALAAVTGVDAYFAYTGASALDEDDEGQATRAHHSTARLGAACAPVAVSTPRQVGPSPLP